MEWVWRQRRRGGVGRVVAAARSVGGCGDEGNGGMRRGKGAGEKGLLFYSSRP